MNIVEQLLSTIREFDEYEDSADEPEFKQCLYQQSGFEEEEFDAEFDAWYTWYVKNFPYNEYYVNARVAYKTQSKEVALATGYVYYMCILNEEIDVVAQYYSDGWFGLSDPGTNFYKMMKNGKLVIYEKMSLTTDDVETIMDEILKIWQNDYLSAGYE